jgi:flagellar hook-length control protein FliK
VASVAADPSAIAPPLPLPVRSDAASPAGPSSAFADLLVSAAPAAAPQPQNGSTSRADDGSNPAQAGAAPGGAAGSLDPAGGSAAPGSHTAKNAGAKNADDQTTPVDSGAAAANATADVTLVGLPLLPFALAPLPNADQTTAAPQNAQGAPADPAQATGGEAAGQQGDRKDASAPSDYVPTGLVAGLPGLVAIPAAAAADASPQGSTGPVAPLPLNAAIPIVLSGPNMSASTAGPDVHDASVPQTPDGPPQPNVKAPAAPENALPLVPAVASELPPADELPPAALPASLQATAGTGTSDQIGRSAAAAPPVTMPAASFSTFPPAAALAPVNAVPPTPLSTEIRVADQPAGNTASPREGETIPLPLPAQVAIRFAASVHANDAETSDGGTDALLGFAGGTVGGSTATSSDSQTGGALPPSFNPAVPATMQAPSIQATAPQHASLVSNPVPLAGIPIAIVARAEAGEKKFEIRLDPPDLGRIEVQLNVDSSSRATSHIIVDRADTLDLLRRDAPALERALQSAGLTTDDGALQFSLRDQSFAGRDQGAPAPFTPPPLAAAGGELAPVDTAARRYGPPLGLGGGIDIRV